MIARPSDRGWTIWIGGRSDRDRLAYSRDFERLVKRAFEEARRLRRLARAEKTAAKATELEATDIDTAELSNASGD